MKWWQEILTTALRSAFSGLADETARATVRHFERKKYDADEKRKKAAETRIIS